MFCAGREMAEGVVHPMGRVWVCDLAVELCSESALHRREGAMTVDVEPG